ncbi:PAS domain S-box-containing protein [Motilibacter rhizosphaerae]|uniref:PAS domain S-box-containing protein n=1 Tax=Motilibacter rhizosphaerae TaxID=598652 RepID=A0A4Q7NV54_9ACTN|nr:PAS domain S-box-containing protein [Motilibacter rhizosphaerae]
MLDLSVAAPDLPAVLVVDPATDAVVAANAPAGRLAPETALPAPLRLWAAAAELREPVPLSPTPLLDRVVSASVVPVQEVLVGAARRPHWMIAMPVPVGVLLVLLPLPARSAHQPGRADSVEVQHAPVLATGTAFCLADARKPDAPLVWVSPGFTVVTGYAAEEVVGRNCRFLQGPHTDPRSRRQVREAITAGRDTTVTLLNYRKDGTGFWNRLGVTPVYGTHGELAWYAAVQTDVTALVQAEQAGRERDQAVSAERVAREDAASAEAQVELLSTAGERLTASLEVGETVDRLADLVVPALADWALLVTSERPGTMDRVLARHPDADPAFLRRYEAEVLGTTSYSTLFAGLLTGGGPRRYADYDGRSRRAQRTAWAPSYVLDMTERLGARSAMYVPLPGRHHIVGALGLFRGADRPAFSERDLQIAVDLGARAGLALDNALLYTAQHRIAEVLQRSLLPELPAVPGITAAAAYQPSDSAADVGGDFYELVPLPDGSTGLAIGDVVGHDTLAAGAMGHLRGLLRACAWDTSYRARAEGERRRAGAAPGVVLERVDRLLAGLGIGTLATAAYATLARPDEPGAPWAVCWSSAGHPPLVVRLPDGSVEQLDGGGGVMLGVRDAPRTTACRTLPAGSTLVAYTDGLVERRGEHLDDGLARLRALVAAGPAEPSALAAHLLDQLPGREDDVALLVVRVE